MKITTAFKEQVEEVWGDSHDVAEAATDELIRHIRDAGFKFDDQDDHVLKVLALAGETKGKSPTIFIERFKKEILVSMMLAKS